MKIGKERIHNLPMNDVTSLGAYAQQLEIEAQAKGIVLPPAVRLQIGEPSFRTPEHIRQAAIEAVAHEPMIYGPAGGWPWLRELLAAKIQRVNGYSIQPSNTAIAVGGTGAVLVAMLATLNPGDEVLIPDPCWPMYFMQLATSGVVGVPYPLDPYNEWLPDTSSLEKLVTPRTRMVIMNTPGNPTGAVMPLDEWKKLFALSDRYGFVIASDECYSEIYFRDEPPLGGLEAAAKLGRADFKNLIAMTSLSKRSNVPGMRSGFVAGDVDVIKSFLLYRTYHGSAMSGAVGAASIAAWGDETHVIDNRALYRSKFATVTPLLEAVLDVRLPDAAFYLWAGLPDAWNGDQTGDDEGFARALYAQYNVTVLPGSYLARDSQGSNPGRGRIRMALVADTAECVEAAGRIVQFVQKGR